MLEWGKLQKIHKMCFSLFGWVFYKIAKNSWTSWVVAKLSPFYKWLTSRIFYSFFIFCTNELRRGKGWILILLFTDLCKKLVLLLATEFSWLQICRQANLFVFSHLNLCIFRKLASMRWKDCKIQSSSLKVIHCSISKEEFFKIGQNNKSTKFWKRTWLLNVNWFQTVNQFQKGLFIFGTLYLYYLSFLDVINCIKMIPSLWH